MRIFAVVLGPILFVIAFNGVAVGLLMTMPPAVGVGWAIGLGAAFLWWYLRKGDAAARRRAEVRVRSPAAPGFRIALVVGATMALAFGVGEFVTMLTPPLDMEDLGAWERILAYQSTPGGWIALALLVALVIPMVEEFTFRGHMLRGLERRWGVVPAVVVTALLFTACHVTMPHPTIMLIPLTLGLALGAAVHLFGSVWVAVGIHGLWNGTMLGLEAVGGDAPMSGLATPEAAADPLRGAILIAAGLAGWLLLLRHGPPDAADPTQLRDDATQEEMERAGIRPPPGDLPASESTP